jgi:hypothetical protein
MGKNGMILFDRPKPTVGCSASGRRRRRRRRRRMQLLVHNPEIILTFYLIFTTPL